MTNRALAYIAQAVAEAFPGAFSPSAGAVTIGNPVRPQVAAAGAERPAPRSPRHLLVFGGSQGAQVLNRVVPAALACIAPDHRPAVVHQCGRGRKEETEARYRDLGVEADVREFIDDMAGSFRWADLAVTRSGALTVAELAAAALPAVLVPFPAAVDDHQTANAQYLVGRGAARLMPESMLTAEGLASAITELTIQDAAALKHMSSQALSCAQLGTAEKLADLCLAQIERRAA
jgi:UDP-N-acetylglucosamine--N-acetylmuramyl-(pentapeptide) pyrophosphoryl-undecaprenol N-acetylglucosamine transferase